MLNSFDVTFFTSLLIFDSVQIYILLREFFLNIKITYIYE